MKTPLWMRAASFAALMHKDETRDDDETPYFSHPARVAMIVSSIFGCEDETAVAAAYLHDVMENTDEGYDDIEERFGRTCAGLVVALTKNMMLPRKERERDYEKRLLEADWRARLIKLADMYDNYTDTLAGLKDGKKEELQKCRAAMKLARRDASNHPETARALRALRKLCG
jgi:guanosine-3',5'-bis(diphosphate) 3'-pyrophosphohydrolase